MRITTKDIKKRRQALHEIRTQRKSHRAKVVFQIHPRTVSGLNLSNNISVPQVTVNIRETEHSTFFDILKLLTFRLYESFHKTAPPLWNYPINSPRNKKNHPIHFLRKKVCPPCKFIILVLVIPQNYYSALFAVNFRLHIISSVIKIVF